MIQTQFRNKPDIGQMFSYNIATPWIQYKYIKGRDTDEKQIVQGGEGYIQAAQAAIAAAPIVAKTIDKALFGKIGTSVSNTLGEHYNKNPLWRPGFAGERHAILPTKKGWTRANFAGPGTHLDKRLARGDESVDGPFGIDAAAKKHDIKYANATSFRDIRKADNELIDDVRRSDQSSAMKRTTIGIIKAKKFGENVGVFSKDIWLPKSNQQIGHGCYGKRKYNKDTSKKKKVYPGAILEKLHKQNESRRRKHKQSKKTK